MNRLMTLVLVLLTYFASPAWPQALKPTQPLNQNAQLPHFPRRAGFRQMPQPFERVGPAIAPASATKDVVWIQCPPDAYPGALCGNVPVPLDRKHPKQGTININFELYTHSNPGPAESALLFNIGGPGVTTTGNRLAAFWLLGQNLDVHDLLLIDDRGSGLSGPIDCEELQHGTAPWDQAMADCAAQLGSTDSRYGTGDVGRDTEAVRAALGYDQVDYYGISAGGEDIAAYATRFGSHLRSIVGVAVGWTPTLFTPFVDDRYRTRAERRAVNLDCNYSPTCSADHPFPKGEFDALVWTIELSPVEGYAYDANGNLQHVVLDENALLNYVILNNTGRYASTGEILAAADSLWLGDPAPLLRLGAEGFPISHDWGDPTGWSAGAFVARFCVDMTQPWDWSKPVSARSQQFAEAVGPSLPVLRAFHQGCRDGFAVRQ
jgi:pimeloyl-ACP methyl ester carboxylesterase